MNYEPPDFTKDVSSSSNRDGGGPLKNKRTNFYQRTHVNDCSPLLRTNPPATHFDKNGVQNRNSSIMPNQNFKPLHNRLGYKNSLQNNTLNSVQMNNDNFEQRNFNRKRVFDLNNGPGPLPPKRKWNKKRPNFYHNANNSQANTSVQSRMNRIRNNSHLEENDQIVIQNDAYKVPESTSNVNDLQDFDATDITVEVVNSAAIVPEDGNLTKFKMILDNKTQTAIRLLQQKRKDKQVIFPFPVTPNVTAISLHERFSML